ncbi:MAG: hypothetical protein Q9167_006223 [Letrouitia subvulpina]
MPRSWRNAGLAVTEFQAYITRMLSKEKELISQGGLGSANLMSLLVKESEEAQQSDIGDVKARDNQSWMYDEFPRLKRCLAVMLESLRLYSPVAAVPKYTGDRSQPLDINGRNHVIPPGTLVMLNIFAMHTNPRYWGKDSLTWRPSRWIIDDTTSRSGNGGARFDDEKLLDPRKGTYFPWSGGARVCIGKKFSQVEFVAVMATLFFNHRVQPIAAKSETQDLARKRIMRIVEDSLLRMTLQVRRPSLAAVSWVKV